MIIYLVLFGVCILNLLGNMIYAISGYLDLVP